MQVRLWSAHCGWCPLPVCPNNGVGEPCALGRDRIAWLGYVSVHRQIDPVSIPVRVTGGAKYVFLNVSREGLRQVIPAIPRTGIIGIELIGFLLILVRVPQIRGEHILVGVDVARAIHQVPDYRLPEWVSVLIFSIADILFIKIIPE